jgi:hypothetical protein
MIGTEGPVQQKIVDYLASIGYRPVDRKEMVALRSGRMGEPLIEPLLADASEAERGTERDRSPAGG